MTFPLCLSRLAFTLLLAAASLHAQVNVSIVAQSQNTGSTEALSSLDPAVIGGGNYIFRAFEREGQFNVRNVLRLNNVTAVRGGGAGLPPGDMAPGTGATFSGFSDLYVNGAGQIAFKATRSDASEFGVWAGTPGSLQLVALDGAPAPGTNGNFLLGTGGSEVGQIRAFNDAGQVAISARVAGAPNGTADGRWVGTASTLGLVARQGSQAPGFANGVTWTSLGDIQLNASGQIALSGIVSEVPPAALGTNSTNVIVVGLPGALQVVARAGQPAPEAEPFTLLRFLSDQGFTLNAAGQVAFRTSIWSGEGGVTPNSDAIYVSTPDGLRLVARTLRPAPGTDADATFNGLDKPVLNAAGEVAFTSSVSSAARPSGKGIWLGKPGRLRLIARTDEAAPGTGGQLFRDFPQNAVLLTDSGQIAFTATVDPGGTTGNNGTTALFATDKTGVLRFIARVGAAVGSSGNLTELQFGISLSGSSDVLSGSGDGRRTAFDAGGRLVFFARNSPDSRAFVIRATFDDSAPVILANGQPQSVGAVLGGSATFEVTALGTRPATYQWKKDGNDLAGETGATLTLTNLTTDDRGAYTVVVTNALNSVTSDPAQLTFPPTLTQQPASQNVNAGNTVLLSVTATGLEPLTYQWQSKAAGAAEFTNIGGANGVSLSLANIAANQAGRYRVLVTNSDGTATSAEAVVTVAAAGAPIVTRVVIPGDPAPGLSDVPFSRAEVAVLNNEGEMAFEGKIGTDVSGANQGTYFRTADGQYRFVTYQAFNVNLSDSGDLAQVNSRPITTIEHGTPGDMLPLARRNTTAPGGAGDYSLDGSYNFAADGTVAFRFDTHIGTAAFIGQPGNVSLLAAKNMAAPGLASGVTFNFVLEPVINPGGTAAFWANLQGTGITADNDTSIWTGTAAGIQRVVAEDDLVPAAGSGVRVGEIFTPDSRTSPFGWNAAGQLAFSTQLAGTGITSANDRAILAGAPGALVVVARDGVANGHTFDLPGRAYPIINSIGQVAFVANVTPTGSSDLLESLWLWTPGAGGGTRRLIAREGQAAPGLPAGVTFGSTTLGNPFFTAAINGLGQLVFTTYLAGPGISFDDGNDVAVYLVTPTGELKLVVRQGNPIDLGGGETRVAANVRLPLRSGGEDGRPRSFSESGDVLMSLGFKEPNGSVRDYGLFLARLPGASGGGSAPIVTTQAATAIVQTGATLAASVNPNGAAATVRFEYGTTTSYGQLTPVQDLPAGSTAVPVSAAITGLTANTTYHFRAVATNASGTTNGSDLTFTTSGSGVPFTVRLVGQEDGVVVVPGTDVEIEALIEPAGAGGATITGVQFFVNDDPRSPDTEAPYEFSSTVEAPGPREIYAVATDLLGRTATSPSISIVVADAAAGALALQTFVEPENGEIAPGGAVTYLLVATNTSTTAKLKAVKLTAPTPDNATVESANFVDENNNPVRIKAPSGKNPAIAKDGSSVGFYFGDFQPLEVKRARLKLRVPFDVHEGDEPIVNLGFDVRGKLGRTTFSGRFATRTIEIIGTSPANAPQLALSKGIVDLEANKKDNTEFAATADGALALTANGDSVTFLLVATNAGGLPARRVTVNDRVPEGFAYDEGSAKVNGRNAGPLLKVKGRTLAFTFGDFAPGENVVITYQLKVKAANAGGPAVGTTVVTAPAEMHARNLKRGVDSAPERLSILILPPTTVVVQQPKALPEQISVGGLQTYRIPFTNPSQREARGVRIRAVLPAHTAFVKAFLEDAPLVTFPLGADNSIVFEAGTVGAGEGGVAHLEVTGQSGLLTATERGVVFPPPVVLAPLGSAPAEAETAALNPFALDLFPEFNAVRDPNVPLVGILKQMPMSVHEGEVFACLFTLINFTDKRAFAQLNFDRPEGTLFDHYDDGVDGSPSTPITPDQAGIGISYGFIEPHTTRTIRFFFKATGAVGSAIIENTARMISPDGAPGAEAKASATLIIHGEASEPDNQITIARAQLSLENNDASAAMSDPLFLTRVKSISASSRYFFLNGADGFQLLSGGAVVPTGAGRMIAAGGGNLVGNDGSTIENNGGATLVGQDGGTIVLYGPAEEITFNLVGNDGASLVGQDGSTLVDQTVRGTAGNLVAAGAGNLVAAGAGNLVRTLVGNDGSTITQLVGNDGSTFAPDALIASIRAAGGDLFAVGAGAFIPSADSIISNGESALVAAGGGNLVAAGGGNFVSDLGSGLISVDHSRVTTYGLNGSVMTTGGLISDNGAILQLAPRKPQAAAAAR